MSKTVPGGIYRSASGDLVDANGEPRKAPTKTEMKAAGLPTEPDEADANAGAPAQGEKAPEPAKGK